MKKQTNPTRTGELPDWILIRTMRSFRELVKWMLRILAGSFVVILAAYCVLYIVFSIELHNVFSALRKTGAPLTIAEIRPPAIPDNENAAYYYSKAFLIDTTQAETEIETLYKLLPDFPELDRWIRENRKELNTTINGPEGKKFYDLIREGSSKSHCNFNLKYEEGGFLLLPHLSKIRRASEFVSLKALLEAGSTSPQRSFDTILVGLKLCRHLSEEPIFISQMTRLSCVKSLARAMERIIRDRNIPIPVRTELLQLLAGAIQNRPLAKAISAERVCLGDWAMRETSSGSISVIGLTSDVDLDGKWQRIAVNSIWRPFLKKDFAFYLMAVSQVIKNYELPYYRITPEMRIDTLIRKCPEFCLFSRATLLGDMDSQAIANVSLTELDLFRTGIAVRAFKEKQGIYPPSLGNLVPSILPEIPIDRFTGKSFIYRKNKNGFLLYSAGPDLTDNGGVPQQYENGCKWKVRKNTDIVWNEKIL